MIGYVCKYTPLEILKCFDEEIIKIEPNVSNFDKADAMSHPNLCTYSKGVIEEILNKNIDKVILTNCCDSMKRVYDVLQKHPSIKFIYLIDVPRKINKFSIEQYKLELQKFINAYENFSNRKFSYEKFMEILAKDLRKEKNISSNINIAVLGARCPKNIITLIKNSGANVSINFTCSEDNTRTSYLNKLNISADKNILLLNYAEALLSMYPCMRMAETDLRLKELNNNKDSLSGIIYHSIKFCDNYSFEYAKIKDKVNLPILKIETDYTEQSIGQIKTRIEAFIESICVKNNILYKNAYEFSAASKTEESTAFENQKEFIIGIDSGSTSTNAVIIDKDKNIAAYSIVRTGAKSIDSANRAYAEVLQKAGLKEKDIALIVSTGYGRVSIPFANMNVTEITCHGKGAYFLNKNLRTIIDVGGQDSKAIRINEKGEVVDFAMNDKCAAGTGRFLEMMARTLETPIENMGLESLKWKEDINITNMCSVFAESEVISLIAQNKEKADIIHGLNKSIANKISSLLGRTGKCGEFMMTGGVAKNIGVVKALEEKLGEKIFIYKEPEIVGALGAALIGYEHLHKNNEYNPKLLKQ